MQEITEQPTTASEATDGLTADALRAEAWAGEPFLREGEDAAKVLAPGTSRRRALDDALKEIEGGRRTPSSGWKVEYGLMLGLERVLAEEKPHLASGTELRRHQVDALAGMLTELIAAHERGAELNGNGAAAEVAEGEPELEEEDEPADESSEDVLDEEVEEETYTGPDPGAARRYRFRHPTASGKTIAAAGFVEAARTLGVLILTHRRLLVSQFQRDLTDEGYGERFAPAVERGKEPLTDTSPLTIQTYAWFARHVDSISRDAYQVVEGYYNDTLRIDDATPKMILSASCGIEPGRGSWAQPGGFLEVDARGLTTGAMPYRDLSLNLLPAHDSADRWRRPAAPARGSNPWRG